MVLGGGPQGTWGGYNAWSLMTQRGLSRVLGVVPGVLGGGPQGTRYLVPYAHTLHHPGLPLGVGTRYLVP